MADSSKREIFKYEKLFVTTDVWRDICFDIVYRSAHVTFGTLEKLVFLYHTRWDVYMLVEILLHVRFPFINLRHSHKMVSVETCAEFALSLRTIFLLSHTINIF